MPIYMKYEGIEGTATGKHKGWIELESCQLGVHRNISAPTGRANREANVISVNEIVITKRNDNSSTHLFRESVEGKQRKVIIDFVKNDNEAPYLSIVLENVMISSYSISGRDGGYHDKPTESLSLNFTKVTYATTPTASAKDSKQAADTVTWDIAVTK